MHVEHVEEMVGLEGEYELGGQDDAWSWGYALVVLDAHMMRTG